MSASCNTAHDTTLLSCPNDSFGSTQQTRITRLAGTGGAAHSDESAQMQQQDLVRVRCQDGRFILYSSLCLSRKHASCVQL